MNKTVTGGPAFPPMHDPNTHVFGMTLRDYFAAKELTTANRGISYLHDPVECKRIAGHCYLMADAMLEARK